MNLEETKEKDLFQQQNTSDENMTSQYVNADIAQEFDETELIFTSNIVTGVIGALVGSLLGVVFWIAIYHAGYIASIAGIAIIFCALKGYEILGGSLDKQGVIIASVISLIMVFVANHLAWTFEVYMEMSKYQIISSDMSFFDVLKNMSDFISLADSWKEYYSDLGVGYILTLIGGASMIIKKYKQAE